MDRTTSDASSLRDELRIQAGLRDYGKIISISAMDMCASLLQIAVERMNDAPQDPLSVEKYVFVADKLSQIAERMITIFEED